MRNIIKLIVGLLLLISCAEKKHQETKDDNQSSTTTEQALMDQEKMKFIMGHFDPESHPDFVIIGDRYTSKTGIYLQKETYEAFVRMHNDAAKEGVELGWVLG